MKAIITLSDLPDGKIGVQVTFDPPMKRSDFTTPAVLAAFDIVGWLKGKPVEQRQSIFPDRLIKTKEAP